MIKAIVTDIEGTTSSLAFVKEVLFPYARANLADYVRRNIAQEQVKKILTTIFSIINWILITNRIRPNK